MIRSPFAYPLNRHSDMDGGGAADLQTDIMRFMAILSLCLMAIFALVQSMPLTPAVETLVEPVGDAVVEPIVVHAVVEPVVVHAEKPLENSAGISLRFASDAALMRLVAARQIGLYAIEANRAQRMTIRDSRISFWDASTPKAFHEMEATTVPDGVVDAFTRTATDSETVRWGVTLPGKLRTQLQTLMQQHDSGALVIDANGDIRWEES